MFPASLAQDIDHWLCQNQAVVKLQQRTVRKSQIHCAYLILGFFYGFVLRNLSLFPCLFVCVCFTTPIFGEQPYIQSWLTVYEAGQKTWNGWSDPELLRILLLHQ